MFIILFHLRLTLSGLYSSVPTTLGFTNSQTRPRAVQIRFQEMFPYSNSTWHSPQKDYLLPSQLPEFHYQASPCPMFPAPPPQPSIYFFERTHILLNRNSPNCAHKERVVFCSYQEYTKGLLRFTEQPTPSLPVSQIWAPKVAPGGAQFLSLYLRRCRKSSGGPKRAAVLRSGRF